VIEIFNQFDAKIVFISSSNHPPSPKHLF